MAHFLVADGQIDQRSNHTGSQPYTFGQIGCGMEAQYIHLTPSLIFFQINETVGYIGEFLPNEKQYLGIYCMSIHLVHQDKISFSKDFVGFVFKNNVQR